MVGLNAATSPEAIAKVHSVRNVVRPYLHALL
jgi:hypothetical protein